MVHISRHKVEKNVEAAGERERIIPSETSNRMYCAVREVRFHNDKPCLIITNRFLDDMRIISPANSYINIRGH